jgi:hypothetical protein
MGFRNFSVTTLEPLGCLATQTIADGYTACIPVGNNLTAFHNAFLVLERAPTLPIAANLIVLDGGLTFASVLNGSIPSGENIVLCTSYNNNLQFQNFAFVRSKL